MMAQSSIDALKAMRFTAMAAELERQLCDPGSYSQLGFEERLSLLVDAEWNRRQQNKLLRGLHNAHFAAPGATIEEIEYHEDRRLDKAQILRFATCKYIDEGHHIILKGASGSGKTYLACALGNAACRKFRSVRYIRLPELLEELSLAQAAADSRLKNPTICWNLWRPAVHMAPPSSAPSMTPANGMSVLTPVPKRPALFPRLLWTALSTMPTTFSLMARFPCGSAMASGTRSHDAAAAQGFQHSC